MFEIVSAPQVLAVLDELAGRDPKRHKKVMGALARLAVDPRHPGLNSHPYVTKEGPNGESVWESYVENHTPSAWRIWWCYDANYRLTIFIIEVGPHP